MSLEQIAEDFVELDPESKVEPDPSTAAIYAGIYQRYLELNSAIAQISGGSTGA